NLWGRRDGMRRLLKGFLVMGLALLGACADQSGSKPNDTSFAALKQEYDEANKKFQDDQQKRAAEMQESAAARLKAAEKELAEAKTDEEKTAAQQKVQMARTMQGFRMSNPMAGPGADFSPRFLAFAEKYPNDPSAFESLLLAL